MKRATLALVAAFAAIVATAETSRTATENWTRNRIAEATNGLVKSATVNGGAKVTPDASGNLALTVESVPSDYSTVRTNAATGAAHAAETGNPHGTTAEQVGAYTTTEVDEKISQNAAHYLTAKVGGAFVQFATHAALAAAKAAHTDENPQFWYGDDPHTPDKNDYLTILDDETHDHATTRYMFVGEWPDGFFRYQYTINATALTQAQWDALNSGANKTKINAIEAKRDKTDLDVYEMKPSPDGPWTWTSANLDLLAALDGVKPFFNPGGGIDGAWDVGVGGDWTCHEKDVSKDALIIDFRFDNLSTGDTSYATATREATVPTPTGDTLATSAELASKIDAVNPVALGEKTQTKWRRAAKLTVSGGDFQGAMSEYWEGGNLEIGAGGAGGRLTLKASPYPSGNETRVAVEGSNGGVEICGGAEDPGMGLVPRILIGGKRVALEENVPTAAKITEVAEASIKDKAMPTTGAVEGSVAARILALEGPKVKTFEQLKAYIDTKVADRSFANDDERIAKMKSEIVGIEITDRSKGSDGNFYYNPMIVVNVAKWLGEDNQQHIGAMVMRKYCEYNDVVFDMPNQEEATEEAALEGVYYYGLALGASTVAAENLTLLDLEEGDPLPKGNYQKIFKCGFKDTTRGALQYGRNNWRDSAYRQWLNSWVAKGTSWWSQKSVGQVSPQNATTIPGYLQGCSGFYGLNPDGTPKTYTDGLLKFAKPVYIYTSPNGICDGGSTSDPSVGLYQTLDLFFLPSAAEMYASNNTSGSGSAMIPYEGEFSPYWKEATGFDIPSSNRNTARTILRAAGRSIVSTARLRSAYRSNSFSAAYVGDSGLVSFEYAKTSYRATPACVIY